MSDPRVDSVESKTNEETFRGELNSAKTTFFYIKNLSTNLWRDKENLEAICRTIRKYAENAEAQIEEVLRRAREGK